MPLNCIICQEVLFSADEDPTAALNPNEGYPVTTQCGHLYHSSCILRWFSTQSAGNLTCPYCKKTVMHPNFPGGNAGLVRIYPSIIGDNFLEAKASALLSPVNNIKKTLAALNENVQTTLGVALRENSALTKELGGLKEEFKKFKLKASAESSENLRVVENLKELVTKIKTKGEINLVLEKTLVEVEEELVLAQSQIQILKKKSNLYEHRHNMATMDLIRLTKMTRVVLMAVFLFGIILIAGIHNAGGKVIPNEISSEAVKAEAVDVNVPKSNNCVWTGCQKPVDDPCGDGLKPSSAHWCDMPEFMGRKNYLCCRPTPKEDESLDQ